MKKILYLYIAWSIMTGFVSCKKNSMPIYDAGAMKHGSISACRNGNKWVASGEAVRLPIGSLFIIEGSTFGYNQQDSFSIERLNMMYLPLKKGRYAVTNKSMSNIQAPYAGMSIVNYDIIIDDYYLDKDKESWVELTQVDTINNRVEGCFQIYLEIEAPKRGEQNADKLCFKRGRFSVDIIE